MLCALERDSPRPSASFVKFACIRVSARTCLQHHAEQKHVFSNCFPGEVHDAIYEDVNSIF